jgi:SAM-dependent methyltransferase
MSLAQGLLDGASAPYRAAGHVAYHLARGKLTHDPVFEALLARGLLTRRAVILDLGCGQGLLAALLLAARAASDAGAWPAHWPPSPQPSVVRGIELVNRHVRRAQRALGRRAEFIAGDVRRVDFGSADGIVILDVLHYIAYGDQRDILERAHRALTPSGVLLLRVGDAAGGVGFVLGKCADRVMLLAGGRGADRLYCRTASEWHALLSAAGFDSEIMPMSGGTPFANVLIVAKPT